MKGQMSLFDFIEPPPEEELLPCDSCGHQVQGCCNYPCTPDDYCVLGDKKIPRFSWDDDINEIHRRLVELVEKHKLSVYSEEWAIWSHVPQYGYRMDFQIDGLQKMFTDAFMGELGKIVEYAKENQIELSPMQPHFFNADEVGTMYVYSTFMDKERRKRK